LFDFVGQRLVTDVQFHGGKFAVPIRAFQSPLISLASASSFKLFTRAFYCLKIGGGEWTRYAG
jgi:hypothetical protein